ncbi:putative exported protein [Halobacteriovorax marinus SJ]|uniref:Exported protein n=1 Tax=Halobacteriovorax marinus (strain ATCC BAA-682 / DSM 15412 / SJ) TaxID=862908 RepID=E1X402_HALMS|nr:NAD(P)/FAD-dependent oxidoreductase [Halobacteriovorax marinus]CBW25342.1 putative exported protein [Halobacteriovorax marinus SJ]
MNSKVYDVLIIGGGAAGLMAASVCAKRGKTTLLLEGNKAFGKKILISGGGRCNFTNLFATHENYQSENQHFFKSALKRYSPYDFLDLVEKYKIEYVEKKAGQLFCKQSARSIVEMLVSECEKSGSELVLNTKVLSVGKLDDLFQVQTASEEFQARNLIVATGGLPIAQIGGNDFGLGLAREFKLATTEVDPALVPFKLKDSLLKKTSALSGVSLPVRIFNERISFDEDLLFTHKGLSGPAILQISLYWNVGESVTIDFLPTENSDDLISYKKSHPKRSIDTFLKSRLPKKFVEYWCQRECLSLVKKLADYSNDELIASIEALKNFSVNPAASEGYRKAEVMRGGVSTDEISSKTMEAKSVKGLYFIGEVVDVTGQLGGFNFQWAWASAHAAGQSII